MATISEPKSLANATSLRVAMADDEPTEHLLMRMAAEEAAIEADFSFYCDGEDLLSSLRPARERVELPHVIILDLRMPGLDGYETLDRLNGDPELWTIPVVLLTASTRDIERSLSLSRGACLFRQKSGDFSELVNLARSLPDVATRPGRAGDQGFQRDIIDESDRAATSDPTSLRAWLKEPSSDDRQQRSSTISDEARIAELERRVRDLEARSTPISSAFSNLCIDHDPDRQLDRDCQHDSDVDGDQDSGFQ